MNDATNDATEFESSMDGAIGFFQNLRRKLGTLEQDASVQHDRLHAIAASIAHLERERQIDQQTFTTLAGHLEAQTAQLTELRADGRLLDEQLDAIEALVACFQQTQEQLRHQLATLAGDWQAQQADLRQDLEATLAQRASAEQVAALETQLARQAEDLRNLLASAQILSQDTRVIRDRSAGHESRLEQHHGQIGQLETAVRTSQEQLGQFNSLAETQYQHLHRLESALGAIDQSVRGFGQMADGLKITLDRHDHALDTLCQAVETHEAAQRQWREQQGRLDEFADALDARRQESQTLQQGLAQVRDELETQHQTLHEVRQTRQDVQKQQDRLKHLETLIGKVSADTNSTRQILNILQSDLITQSDTLRELDEHWQATLAAYQSAALPSETPAQSPVPPDSSPDADLREAAQQHAATLTQALELQQGDVRETAATVEDLQQEVGELRQILTRLEATADQRQPGTEADHQQELEIQQNLASLQQTMAALEERLSGQAQAFSGNFEQFRALADDIRNLQQQISTLESVPRRLNALEEEVVGREQSITQLQDTVRQLREDSRQAGEALQKIDTAALAGELETQLNEQRQQFTQLNDAIDAIRTDAKTTQEKVITMATNVAKRIFEFQNQLTATETAHATRLQEAEQKLIQLQAALETLETQHRPRRWFSMPAMFTHLTLTVGAAFLAVLVTVIWTTI
ncbi:MAG: hypothetical protein EA420_07760 [Candidatus Competibacteraceae bacterium]|nr:MAG: hypothetical protein EA420_07760 [Candidatus Competibacteraceae bacterium]